MACWLLLGLPWHSCRDSDLSVLVLFEVGGRERYVDNIEQSLLLLFGRIRPRFHVLWCMLSFAGSPTPSTIFGQALGKDSEWNILLRSRQIGVKVKDLVLHLVPCQTLDYTPGGVDLSCRGTSNNRCSKSFNTRTEG